MASETNTTSKPKRLTPTQARAARRQRHQRRKRFVRYLIGGGVALLALLFIIALFVPDLTNLRDIGGGAPDGPGTRIESIGTAHISPGQEHDPYTSVPATSGSHYGQPLAPTRWGIHSTVLADEVLVHNLEHGGIGIHYNCPDGCEELVGQLTELVNRAMGENLKVVMSPYAGMDTRIALTAWTFIDKFEEFDERRITDFIQAHESSPTAPEPLAR